MGSTNLSLTGDCTLTSATLYLPLGMGGQDSENTETNVQVLYRLGGVFSNGYVRISTNARNATSFRTRKGAANGNILISVGAGLTGEFTDNTNTDTVTAGDKWNWLFTGGTGFNNLVCWGLGVAFAATTNTAVYYTSTGSRNFTAASTTTYTQLGGTDFTTYATEASSQVKVRLAGTLKKAVVNVTANRAVTSNVRSRINTANGNINVSLTGGATGFFEDTANTDTIADADLVNFSLTTGTGADTLTIKSIAVAIETTDSTWAGLGMNNGNSPGANTTTYAGLHGSTTSWTTTEASRQIKLGFSTTCTKLGIHVSSMTGTVTSTTFKLRVNGANSTKVVTVVGTGWTEENTNTASIASTDTIDIQCVTNGSSGNITPDGISITFADVQTYTQTLTGGYTPAGALTNQLQALKSIAGTLTSSGSVANKLQALKSISGTVSSSGVLTNVKLGIKSITGTLTSSGIIGNIKKAVSSLTGSITPTGNLIRNTGKVLSGVLTTSGSVTNTLAALKSLSGVLSTFGVVTNRISGRLLSGVIAPTGNLVKMTNKMLSGTLGLSGNLIKLVGKILGGVLFLSGEVKSSLVPLLFFNSTMKQVNIFRSYIRKTRGNL